MHKESACVFSRYSFGENRKRMASVLTVEVTNSRVRWLDGKIALVRRRIEGENLKENFLLFNCYMKFFRVVTGSRAAVNSGFKSYPTTVKTFENDTVLLPCYVEDLGE